MDIMTNPIKAAASTVEALVVQALADAAAAGELPCTDVPPQVTVERTKYAAHGDMTTNVAMVSAKAFRMPPRKIAEAIVKYAKTQETQVARMEIAGPGFLNFFLAPSWWSGVLACIQAEGADYGRSDHGKGQKVMVEFVSANPTGPMHIGNARGGALGDCLAAAMDMAGYDVTREFYVNDAGNQIAKFGMSLEARYLQIFLGEDAVPFPEDGYHGADITQRAQEFARQEGDRYVSADSDLRRKALVEYALPLNIEGLRRDLLAYRIEYDVWFRESSLYADGTVDKVVGMLKEKGLTYEKEGALWYRATQFGGEKDEVLVRANGLCTYFAADIAYHYNKFVTRGFDRVINVWGADHHGHVARLKGAMDALGLDGSRLEIVLMQLVRLMQNGEVARVSKRTGKSITLSNLLEEVPLDAARFFFNLREPSSHLEFDLGLAVEQSSQNPVYYVQYAHARICSIFKKLAQQGIILAGQVPAEQLDRLDQPEERELIGLLAQLPEEIVSAADSRDPAKLTRYAVDLATAFHKFYNSCRVLVEEDAGLTQARLMICSGVRTVLENLLAALKIDAPESM